jgi:hypothetical protein
MQKSILALLLFLAAGIASADVGDDKIEAMKKIPPPITGGFIFKMYGTPEHTGKEVLVEDGVLYIAPGTLTETQITEANDPKYGKVKIDGFDQSVHAINACYAMHQHSTGPEDAVKLLWIGGHKNKSTIRIYSWPDWWEFWDITQLHGKIVIQDTGSDRGWGLKNVRVVADADPSVNLESCLGYLKNHDG